MKLYHFPPSPNSRRVLAVEARKDSDFFFIARTDSRETDGLDDAIDRVNRYCDAGADIAFIEAPVICR